MKNILILLLTIFSSFAFSQEDGQVEELEQAENSESLGYAIFSTFEIAYGARYGDLQSYLVEEAKRGVNDGYDNCVLYRHELGSERSFYMACFFQNLDQYAQIMAQPKPDYARQRQLFSSHTSHMVEMTSNELDGAPDYIMYGKWRPSPAISWEEWGLRMDANANAHSQAFGGCDGWVHAWGPEMANYLVCGFDGYEDFAVKHEAVGPLLSEAASQFESIGVVDQSDELLIRVYP